MGYHSYRSLPSSKTAEVKETRDKEQFRSRVPAGNRNRTYQGMFVSTGGEKRPRISTTLPVETLNQLDHLASKHRLQRNEVLTLALESIAGDYALPEACSRFAEMVQAWRGFDKGFYRLIETSRCGSDLPQS